MAQQTPVQKAGYKVGDKFIVLDGRNIFTTGSEITLVRDDGSQSPVFTSDDCRYNNGPGGSKGAFLNLEHVRPFHPHSIETIRDRLLAIKEERVALDVEDKELREKLTSEGLALLETVAAVAPVLLSRSEWKAGDLLRCVGLDVDGVASLTVGKEYMIQRDGGIIDEDGDSMEGCMNRGCFVWVSRP